MKTYEDENGISYHTITKAKGDISCAGCVGDYDVNLCAKLPQCILSADQIFIWKVKGD